MTILRTKEIAKMDRKARENKLGELKMELIKANITANRTNAKSKEIKKAIARILTFNKLEKTNKLESEK